MEHRGDGNILAHSLLVFRRSICLLSRLLRRQRATDLSRACKRRPPGESGYLRAVPAFRRISWIRVSGAGSGWTANRVSSAQQIGHLRVGVEFRLSLVGGKEFKAY